MIHNVITIRRNHYTDDTTLGEVFINDEKIGYSLEDTCRPYGIKVAGHTAIPLGTYDIKVTRSNRFKRPTPLIYNNSDLSLRSCGVKFDGVRIHGGNSHVDTAGCILIAKRRSIIDESIQGSLEAMVTEHLLTWERRGEPAFIKIINEAFDDTDT